MKIKFCGAATGVTGSCHLISTEKHKILFDCGEFQGGKDADKLNAKAFAFDPSEIEAVVVSHAHIDHCGRLPLLVKRGFKGIIYSTAATADLLDVMLKDAAHIQEQDAERINKKNQRAGKSEIEPLYDTRDAINTLKYVRPINYDTLIEVNDQMKICFNEAGHILGSAIIELWVTEGENTEKIVFSGDLGMMDRPILKNPKIIKKADYLIMETTYGNRNHEPNTVSVENLLDIVVKTTKNGGTVVIPSFAVGRTQELIYELNKIYDGNTEYTKMLRNVPVYVDSPMCVEATEVFRKNAQDYDAEMREYILSGDHPLEFKNLHYARTSEESKLINDDKGPKVIIAASGMCDAGRIRHHLKYNLWNEKNAVVFVGYQAAGTVGRLLLDGAKSIKIFGDDIACNAQMYNLPGFSGHADRDALFAWLSGFVKKPKEIFLVHGETESKEGFAQYVMEHKGWKTEVVKGFDEYELSHEGVVDSTVSETAEQDFVSKTSADELIKRLNDAKANSIDVIENAKITLGGELSELRMTEIKNKLAALEAEIINLGASVSK